MKKFVNGGGINQKPSFSKKDQFVYKIKGTFGIEDKIKELFNKSKNLQYRYTKSIKNFDTGTFEVKLDYSSLQKLIPILMKYDKDESVYILNYRNEVVFDSKKERMNNNRIMGKKSYNNYEDLLEAFNNVQGEINYEEQKPQNEQGQLATLYSEYNLLLAELNRDFKDKFNKI